MRIHTDVEQARKLSPRDLLTRDMVWVSLGWSLCVVLLLGFSPRLFHKSRAGYPSACWGEAHFQEYLFFILLGIGILTCLWEGKSLWFLALL
jgi:hypothetical protein